MYITNISEAKSSLSQLIKTVQKTKKPIIIGKAGKPVALLSAYIEDETPRKLMGHWKGKVTISDDFDKTDEDLINQFYNAPISPE